MAFDWKRYVSVAERRRKAEVAAARFGAVGKDFSPVIVSGRSIALTFWGKAWCRNLERYSDFTNRLPRGRTYVRAGAVVDLRIGAGEILARVSGSSLYETTVTVAALPKARWQTLSADCAGSIDSLVDLMQGRLSGPVMERICREGSGLFPSNREIAFRCSCPDWAAMCKHVAAVLYGVGARLDESPELLFTLRKVDAAALVARASEGLAVGGKPVNGRRVLDSSKIAELFGIEMAGAPAAPARAGKKACSRRARAKRSRGE